MLNEHDKNTPARPVGIGVGIGVGRRPSTITEETSYVCQMQKLAEKMCFKQDVYLLFLVNVLLHAMNNDDMLPDKYFCTELMTGSEDKMVLDPRDYWNPVKLRCNVFV